MALGDYCTLSEFKEYAYTQGAINDINEDALLARLITSASRAIDRYCRRRFYTTTNDETRYLTALTTDWIEAPDIVSVTTLKIDVAGSRTYGVTLAATDYDLLPPNAALDGLPYTIIRRTPTGTQAFPLYQNGIQVVGKFGFSAIPSDVALAACMQAYRLYKRKDAPFGVMGSAEMGTVFVIPKLDPDIGILLRSFRRTV